MDHLVNQLSPWLLTGLSISTLLMAVVAYANSSYDPSPKWKVLLQGGLLGIIVAGICAGIGGFLDGQFGAIVAVGIEAVLVIFLWTASGTVDAIGCRPEMRIIPCRGCKSVCKDK